MNKSLCRFLALVMAACLSVAGSSALAGSEDASPNLKAAVESLQAAKAATDPGPNLQNAMKYMNRAANNAGGKKDEAIGLVNEAIQLAKDGKNTEMTDKIDHAIAALHMGMSRGGHHHN